MTVAVRRLPAPSGAPPRPPEADYDKGSWRESAACRHADPELFFPVGSRGFAAVQPRQAKSLCAGCPVRRECLRYALDSQQYFGIWGGYDEDERRSLRRWWRERQLAGAATG